MRCVWCVLLTMWVGVGLTAWTIVVSACAGTYDPSLLEPAPAVADAGTEDDGGIND